MNNKTDRSVRNYTMLQNKIDVLEKRKVGIPESVIKKINLEAQNQLIDSIIKELNPSKDDSENIKILLKEFLSQDKSVRKKFIKTIDKKLDD